MENKCFWNRITYSQSRFTSIFHYANQQLRRIIYAKMSANSICTMLYIPCEALTNYRSVAQYSIVLVSRRSTFTYHFAVCWCNSSSSMCERTHAVLANSAVTDSMYIVHCTSMSQHSFACTFSSRTFASQVILRLSSIEYQWNQVNPVCARCRTCMSAAV